MYGRFWEWVTDCGVDNAASGVSETRHGAMEALSKALVMAGGSASGRVVPIALVDGRCGFDYVRLDPIFTASYDGRVIRWHETDDTSSENAPEDTCTYGPSAYRKMWTAEIAAKVKRARKNNANS